MTKSRKIVLWGREDLLGSSVELFLKTQKAWQVISLSHEEKFETLMQTIKNVHPDVVIIQQGHCSGDAFVPMKILQDHPGLKLIALSLKDNLMEVYTKQNILVKSATDLISVVGADII